MRGVAKKYDNINIFGGNMGIGHIIIPPDQQGENRDAFVRDCKRRGRVSILISEGGGVAHNCYIDKSSLKEVVFPSRFGKTGSPVLFYKHPMKKALMVICVYNNDDDSSLLEEHENSIKGKEGESYAEVGVKGKDGQVYINVNSDESDKGSLTINIKNTARTGKLNIKVIGDSEIYTSNECKIRSNNNIDVRVKNVSTSNEYSVKIDKTQGIVFNDNILNSFMLDINELTDKVNRVEDKLKDHQHGYIPYPGGAPGVPVSTTSATALVPPDTTLTFDNTTVDDIKDENIKN